MMRTGKDVDAVDRITIAGLSEVHTVDRSTAAELSEGRGAVPPTGIHDVVAAPQIDTARALCDVESVAMSIISADSPSHASQGNSCVYIAEGTKIVAQQEQYRGRIRLFKLCSVDCDLRERRCTMKDSRRFDDDEVARDDAEQDMIVTSKQEQCESRIQWRRRRRYGVGADSRKIRH